MNNKNSNSYKKYQDCLRRNYYVSGYDEPLLSAQKVIFNGQATIVFWSDNTKTIVKCGKNDVYDPEKGLAMAIAKKALGNKGNYYDTFKQFLQEQEHIVGIDLSQYRSSINPVVELDPDADEE